MGDGFSVVPRELTEAATTIRDLGGELNASRALRYKVGLKAAGDDNLAAAMSEVQEASERTAWVLATTARASADRLSNTAAAYQDVDRVQADLITAEAEPPTIG